MYTVGGLYRGRELRGEISRRMFSSEWKSISTIARVFVVMGGEYKLRVDWGALLRAIIVIYVIIQS